jgi:hypothetical protein
MGLAVVKGVASRGRLFRWWGLKTVSDSVDRTCKGWGRRGDSVVRELAVLRQTIESSTWTLSERRAQATQKTDQRRSIHLDIYSSSSPDFRASGAIAASSCTRALTPTTNVSRLQTL